MFTFNKVRKQATYVITAHQFFDDMLTRNVFTNKNDSDFDNLDYEFDAYKNCVVRNHKHYQAIICPDVHAMIDSVGNTKMQTKTEFVSQIMQYATKIAQITNVPLARIMSEPVLFFQDKFGYNEVVFKCIRIFQVADDQYKMGDI